MKYHRTHQNHSVGSRSSRGSRSPERPCPAGQKSSPESPAAGPMPATVRRRPTLSALVKEAQPKARPKGAHPLISAPTCSLEPLCREPLGCCAQPVVECLLSRDPLEQRALPAVCLCARAGRRRRRACPARLVPRRPRRLRQRRIAPSRTCRSIRRPVHVPGRPGAYV